MCMTAPIIDSIYPVYLYRLHTCLLVFSANIFTIHISISNHMTVHWWQTRGLLWAEWAWDTSEQLKCKWLDQDQWDAPRTCPSRLQGTFLSYSSIISWCMYIYLKYMCMYMCVCVYIYIFIADKDQWDGAGTCPSRLQGNTPICIC